MPFYRTDFFKFYFRLSVMLRYMLFLYHYRSFHHLELPDSVWSIHSRYARGNGATPKNDGAKRRAQTPSTRSKALLLESPASQSKGARSLFRSAKIRGPVPIRFEPKLDLVKAPLSLSSDLFTNKLLFLF
jgi:hypothetical protein